MSNAAVEGEPVTVPALVARSRNEAQSGTITSQATAIEFSPPTTTITVQYDASQARFVIES